MALTFFADWSFKAPELPVDNWWFVGTVLVVLIILIWVVVRLATSATEGIDPAEIDRQMLTAVSELRSQGELTPDEYRSIKGRLVGRLSEGLPSPDSEGSAQKGQGHLEVKGQGLNTTDNPEGEQTTTTKPVDESIASADTENETEKNGDELTD